MHWITLTVLSIHRVLVRYGEDWDSIMIFPLLLTVENWFRVDEGYFWALAQGGWWRLWWGTLCAHENCLKSFAWKDAILLHCFIDVFRFLFFYYGLSGIFNFFFLNIFGNYLTPPKTKQKQTSKKTQQRNPNQCFAPSALFQSGSIAKTGGFGETHARQLWNISEYKYLYMWVYCNLIFFFSMPYLEIAREQMCDSPATVFWIKSN